MGFYFTVKNLVSFGNLAFHNIDMDYNINKKVFWKGEKNKRTTLSLTKNMYEALEDIAKQTGDTVPDIICNALETFLVEMVRREMIQAPRGEEATMQAILDAQSKV